MPQNLELETMPVNSLLIKFAIPAVTGTLVTSLYNVVDRIFLGRYVGEMGIAAVTVAMPLMMIQMAIGMLIGFGTNSQISIKLGEKKQEEAEQLLGQGLFLFTVTSIIFSILSIIYLKPMLRLFGATENVMPYAETYTWIILVGAISSLISFGANNFIRGEGNPKVAMQTMLIGGILNVILDYVFIGIMDWGMAGAAWATVIGYTVSAIWVIYYYVSGKSTVKLYMRNFKMTMSSVRSVMVMGSPSFVMNLIASVQMAIFNNQLVRFGGDSAISIMGVIFSFNMIWLMPIIGVGQGLQPIVGYNYGARQFERVKKALNLAIVYTLLIGTACFLIIELFPHWFFMMFIGDESSPIILLGSRAIRIFSITLPLVGALITISNYFQFTGRPKISLFITLFRQVIFLIPILLIAPEYIGIDGVWATMPLSDIGALLIVSFFFIRERKLLKSLINEQNKHTENLMKREDCQAENRPAIDGKLH